MPRSTILLLLLVFIILIVAVSLANGISVTRLAQALTGIGAILVVTGALALAGLPVLRGDVSEQRPVEAEDLRARGGRIPAGGSKQAVRRQGIALMIQGLVALMGGITLFVLLP